MLGRAAVASASASPVAAAVLATILAAGAPARTTPQGPAERPDAGADARAARIEARMTDDERVGLLSGIMPVAIPGYPVDIPKGVPATAGYIPGIPRLGVPALLATDAGLGVTNPGQQRPGDTATALPSGLALAASFDLALAERAGEMLGIEARAKGFNILLGGGVNLTRDPRNGRNFEYLGEDPLLAGRLAGHAIRGTQRQGVVATIKHFALNGQETQRHTANAVIDSDALRESDLLAFEIGIETGRPGSVMCAYNLVNGAKACGNDALLNGTLKRDWGYKGWVMSDWGAVSGTDFLVKGLDQQSGRQLDKQPWFGEPLRRGLADGSIPRARVSDAVRRILRSLYAVGADGPARGSIDTAADAQVALDVAREGIVLLRNDGVLPLAPDDARRILIVGGQAAFGVLSGGGSSQVTPNGPAPRVLQSGGAAFDGLFKRQVYFASSPLDALKAALPKATFSFSDGYSIGNTAAMAAAADLVIVFATKWEGEDVDSATLDLPQGQDQLIAGIARANRNTLVVLETGNPVTMPWMNNVRAVVEAWYPGQEGGRAIADVLTGRTDPSGRLPITWPRSLADDPRPTLPGLNLPPRSPVEVRYGEGAAVGYRRLDRAPDAVLFPFGYGMSYTRFTHSPVTAAVTGDTVTLRVTVRNDGDRAGADVPQVYLVRRRGQAILRLVGFERVLLRPGESRTVTAVVDRRLLADFHDGGWTVPAGLYGFAAGRSATDLGPVADIALREQRLRP